MVVVRSVSTCTSTEAGSVACSFGSSALMRSTVSITLAPGWRCMFSITPGGRVGPGGQAHVLGVVSTICATSLRRSGAPFL